MARETKRRYEGMSIDELREEGKRLGLSGIWDMRREELVDALASRGGGNGGGDAPGAAGNGGDRSEGPRVQQTQATKYAKEIRSVDEHADRPGQTLVTRNHDVIRRWAETRGAVPATVPGTEHEGRPGVLRFDFPGYGGRELKQVSWDEWFRTFDERNLNFVYQEQTKDGSDSNFFRLDNPDREDA